MFAQVYEAFGTGVGVCDCTGFVLGWVGFILCLLWLYVLYGGYV